jgi:copper chaperone NosL
MVHRKKKSKVMNKLFLLLNLFLLCACGSNAPQPISYGKEDCSSCKMTIVDEKFGTEIITNKGKVYKFDDVNCMVLFMRNEGIAETELKKYLVINYQNKGDFLNVADAYYYVGEDVHSPMNGNAAAFSGKQAAVNFQAGKQGVVMDWKEVYNTVR